MERDDALGSINAVETKVVRCMSYDGSIDANHNFGPTEVVTTNAPLLAVDAVTAAIEECLRHGGDGFFNREFGRILQYPYALYLVIKDDIPAQTLALNHRVWVSRRKPNRRNPGLLAVFLTLNPTTPRERSLCSDYVNVLKNAALNGVAPDKFPEFFASTTIKECKRVIRASKSVDRDARLNAKITLSITDMVEGVKQVAHVQMQFLAEDGEITLARACLSDEVAVRIISELFAEDTPAELRPVLEAVRKSFWPPVEDS